MRTAHLGRLAMSAVFMTLVLGACGGSGGSSSSSSAGGNSSAGGGSGAAATTATQASAQTKSGITPPGTGLKVGQTATVTYTPLTSSGNGAARTVKVTVTSIRMGTSADLKTLDVSGAPAGALPQYATVTVANLGPATIDVDGVSDAMQGIDHSGNQQDPVSIIGDFPTCDQNSSTTPVAAGASFRTCLTYLASGGIAKVGWTGTDSYMSSPVTWSGS